MVEVDECIDSTVDKISGCEKVKEASQVVCVEKLNHESGTVA